MKHPLTHILFALALFLSFALLGPVSTAYAGCPNGTPAGETIDCNPPPDPDGVAGGAGQDTINVNTTVDAFSSVDDNALYGDDELTVNGESDTINVNNGGNVRGFLNGDGRNVTTGGNDFINLNSGGVASVVQGDGTAVTTGGADEINVNVGASVTGSIGGDGYNVTTGGADTIRVSGSVSLSVSGDSVPSPNNLTQGGNDAIIINSGGSVGGNVYGDADGVSTAGDDQITISGSVTGSVTGDGLGGVSSGGADVITINSGGSVSGNLYGDGSDVGAGGNDQITIGGSVAGVVLTDGPIGQLVSGGDDTVTLLDGASIGGIIEGGLPNTGPGETDTLTFAFVPVSEAEATLFATLLAAVPNPAIQSTSGTATLTFRSNTYTWTNFEGILNLVQYVVVTLGQGSEEESSGGIDCGKNPYRLNTITGQYERVFHRDCRLITGDPNESLLHGSYYGEAMGLVMP